MKGLVERGSSPLHWKANQHANQTHSTHTNTIREPLPWLWTYGLLRNQMHRQQNHQHPPHHPEPNANPADPHPAICKERRWEAETRHFTKCRNRVTHQIRSLRCTATGCCGAAFEECTFCQFNITFKTTGLEITVILDSIIMEFGWFIWNSLKLGWIVCGTWFNTVLTVNQCSSLLWGISERSWKDCPGVHPSNNC